MYGPWIVLSNVVGAKALRARPSDTPSVKLSALVAQGFFLQEEADAPDCVAVNAGFT